MSKAFPVASDPMELYVKVKIPDEVMRAENGEVAKRVLEEVVLAGYQSGQLTAMQARRILGYETPMEFDEFLKAHDIYFDYTEENGRDDQETSAYLKSLR